MGEHTLLVLSRRVSAVETYLLHFAHNLISTESDDDLRPPIAYVGVRGRG